jgi:ABC-type antimicrobial peptide transport system permease subunit
VAVGVYGVFAGEVARKRQEIGVRLALGETAQRLVRSMLVSALSLILGGVLLGTAASLLTTRVLRAMLYEVAPTDLLSHIAATALVLAAALAATLFPALQATRVDPVSALRAD